MHARALTFAVSLLLFAGVSTAQNLVDDFTNGTYQSDPISSGSDAAWNFANVPGLVRYTNLSVIGSPTGTAQLAVAFGVPEARLTVGSDVSTNVFLGYGFASGSMDPFSNPVNLDLTDFPYARLRLSDVDAITSVSFFAFTSSGTIDLSTTVLPGQTKAEVDMRNALLPLESILSYGWILETSAGAGYAITSVEFDAVPEPGTVAVLAAGLALINRKRRR